MSTIVFTNLEDNYKTVRPFVIVDGSVVMAGAVSWTVEVTPADLVPELLRDSVKWSADRAIKIELDYTEDPTVTPDQLVGIIPVIVKEVKKAVVSPASKDTKKATPVVADPPADVVPPVVTPEVVVPPSAPVVSPDVAPDATK
jgi:hypothetical protein